jgi:hypothetical protein
VRPARLGGERALEQLEALLAAGLAAEEDLRQPIQRIDLRRRRLEVGAGKLEHLVERARLFGDVTERGRDARLRVERLGEPFAEDLDPPVHARGAGQIIRILLERLTGTHEEIGDERRIVLAAQPVDDLIDRLDEPLGLAAPLGERSGAFVQIGARWHRADRPDQRVERFVAAAELTVERLGHVGQQARLTVRLRVGVEPLFEHLEQ